MQTKASSSLVAFDTPPLAIINNPAFSTLEPLPIWCYATVRIEDGKKQITYHKKDNTPIRAGTPRPYTTGIDMLSKAIPRKRALAFRVKGKVKVVELDHCRDAKTGAIEPWAQAYIERLPTYWEISQSGTGLHSYFFADITSKKARIQHPIPGAAHPKAAIEMFFNWHNIFTGNQLPGTPDIVATLSEEARALYNELEGIVQIATPESTPAPLQDVIEQKYIEAAQAHPKRIPALWNDDGWEKIVDNHNGNGKPRYRSRSEAVMGLCALLYCECDQDISLTDRMFRESRLMDDKWDTPHKANGETYGQMTLRKVAQSYRPVNELLPMGKNCTCYKDAEHGTMCNFCTIYNTINTPPTLNTGIGEMKELLTNFSREELERLCLEQLIKNKMHEFENRIRATPGYGAGFLETMIAVRDEHLRGTPDERGFVRVYLGTIIERTHQSRRTIQYHLVEAERLGLIWCPDKTPLTSNGGRTFYAKISDGLRDGLLSAKRTAVQSGSTG